MASVINLKLYVKWAWRVEYHTILYNNDINIRDKTLWQRCSMFRSCKMQMPGVFGVPVAFLNGYKIDRGAIAERSSEARRLCLSLRRLCPLPSNKPHRACLLLFTRCLRYIFAVFVDGHKWRGFIAQSLIRKRRVYHNLDWSPESTRN